MADHALFIGWGDIVPGREQATTRVFGETMDYFARLQQAGEIEGVEPFFLEPHGGDLGGFFLVRGERDPLARIRASDEFGRIVLRAGMVVQRVGVVGATTGAELNRRLGEFDQVVGDVL